MGPFRAEHLSIFLLCFAVIRCALGVVIWLILELEKKNLNKLHQQKRDMVTKAMSRQRSTTQ